MAGDVRAGGRWGPRVWEFLSFTAGAVPVWTFPRSESPSTAASMLCVGELAPGGVTTMDRCMSAPAL